jgi:hypothetical protein
MKTLPSAWPNPAALMTPFGRAARALVLLAAASCTLAQAATDTPVRAAPWPVVGEMGLMRVVIVPADRATDQAAYEAQLPMLCAPLTTCFLNFHTNTTGAAVALPLPEAIEKEATAVFRRSAKQGAERLMWSCRVKPGAAGCF